MATRFYLADVGTPTVTPAYTAGWNVTTDADRRPLVRKLLLATLDPMVSKTINIPNLTSQNVLSRQYVGEPMRAQTILGTGTVSLVVGCTESGLTSNGFLSLVVTVVSMDGLTSRGTVYSIFTTDVEYATAQATRIVSAAAVTQTAVQAGDRLVVEIGAAVSAPAVSTNIHRYGTSGGLDFALTSALTTDLNPWVEFSQDLFTTSTNNNYQQCKVGDGMSTGEKIR